MTPRLGFAVGAMVLAAVFAGCAKEVSFSTDVYPILERNCVSCHSDGGEGATRSGLTMESYEGLMQGTRYGPVIEPGSSVSSTLVILVEQKAHPSINMPKGGTPLPQPAVDVIKTWIDQGAKRN